MAYWVGVVPGPVSPGDLPAQVKFEDVRLTRAVRPADPVALVALTPTPGLVGVGEIGGLFAYGPAGAQPASVWVRVTRRVDPPVEVPAPPNEPGLYAISPAGFVDITRTAQGARSLLPPEWMVSVSLPIEAETRADAVRAFWAYVQSLGPTELPAFVWPRGNELALQAYVLGDPVNLDPEDG
jgi:hypothetical protein